MLNVSYESTRDLYPDFNGAVAKYWKGKPGEEVEVNQSRARSGKWARANCGKHFPKITLIPRVVVTVEADVTEACLVAPQPTKVSPLAIDC